jgi:hypothetical protein
MVTLQIPAPKSQKEFGDGHSVSGVGGTLVHWLTGSVAGLFGQLSFSLSPPPAPLTFSTEFQRPDPGIGLL